MCSVNLNIPNPKSTVINREVEANRKIRRKGCLTPSRSVPEFLTLESLNVSQINSLTQKVAIVLKYKILGFSGFQTRVLTPLSQVATLNIEKET